MLEEDTVQGCLTRTKVHTFNFVWKIETYAFSKCIETPGRCLNSPSFRSNEIDYTWYLQLYPYRDSDDDGSDSEPDSHQSIGEGRLLSLYLKGNVDSVRNSDRRYQSIKFDVFLENKKGEKVHCKSKCIDLTPGKSCIREGWDGFLNWNHVVGNLCRNDEVTIVCSLRTTKHIHYDIENEKFQIPECHMAEDFRELLLNEESSDVTITVNNNDFKAHKAILWARSPVFAAMFKHDMQEVRKSRVQITDVEPEVFQELLLFIYTGNADVMKFPDKLLAASDKYGLLRLKVMCEEALSKTLTVDNVVEKLALADLHNTPQLISKIVSFIISNYKAVKQTNWWQSIQISPVLKMLIDRALSSSAYEPPKKKLKAV